MTRRLLPHAPLSDFSSAVLPLAEVVVNEATSSIHLGDGATPGGGSTLGRYTSLPSFGNTPSLTPRLSIEHDSVNSAVGANTVSRIVGNKKGTAPGTWMTGHAVYTYDYAGWNGVGANTFVEGIRGESIGYADKTSPYGIIGVATVNTGVSYTYAIGMEGTVNNYYADAPAPNSFTPNSFSAAVVATNGITDFGIHKKSDAAFLVNRYSKAPFRTGVFIDNGSVDHTALRAAGPMVIGIDISGVNASYAAICLGDGPASVVRSGSSLGNMLSTTGTAFSIGTDATAIGFHGVTPIAKPALPAAATDAASTMALANALRSALISYGLAV